LCALVVTNKGLDIINARNSHEDSLPCLQVLIASLSCAIWHSPCLSISCV